MNNNQNFGGRGRGMNRGRGWVCFGNFLRIVCHDEKYYGKGSLN